LNSGRWVLLALVAGLPHTVGGWTEAQQSETTAPSIAISAIGEVRLAAEIALLQIGVESDEKTAARAAAEAASVMSRVLTAMEGLGFDRDSMPTTDYSVGVETDWDGQKISGYTATTAVELRLDDLDTLGMVIDKALEAGANDVSSIRFDVKDRRAARDQAIRTAFDTARRDAEVLAQAAGSSLGRLVQLSIGGPQLGALAEAVTVSAEAAGPRTAITAPEVVVRVTLSGRWELKSPGS
jgi:uncharacterized protein YggE